MQSEVVCRAVKADEVGLAVRMILGRPGELADEGPAGDFIRLAGQRGISFTNLHLAVQSGRMVWAVLAVISPGGTALLLSAPVVNDAAAAAARGVVDLVCEVIALQGVQLAQVLLEPTDEGTVGLYAACDFQPMASLLYLHRAIRRAPAPPPLPTPFVISNYSAETHGLFATGILASYEQSLDCPALNGLRSIDDIIAGHKAAGDFDPVDWFVISHANEPVAVLLLNRTLNQDAMELVYLGVSPAARGRGLGEYLMRLAESRVVQRKLSGLALAVDAQNAPALKLYHRHGMQRAATKLALMKKLKNA